MDGQTLGLHTIGRGGIAPRKMLPVHHDLTFSLAQHPSALICSFLSSDYLMSSGVANDPLFLCGPFIAKYSFCNFFVRFLNLLLNKIYKSEKCVLFLENRIFNKELLLLESILDPI